MFRWLVLLLPLLLWAEIFVDMQGNSVEIGKREKIFASSPTILYSLYAVDRSKIAGLNFAFNDNGKRFIDSKVANLPVIGGWFGKGKTPNSEMVLSVKPDLILLGEHMQNQDTEKIRPSIGGVNIPMIFINSTKLEDIVQSFAYLGRLTGNEKRASELTIYAQRVLNDADKLRKTITNKPKIYYAQGKNGLLTECDSSVHA